MKSLLLTLAFVAYFATGETLMCYECTNPPYNACISPFDKNGVGIIETECQPKSQCYTSTAKKNSTVYVSRGCMITLGQGSNTHIRDNSTSHPGEPFVEMTFCDTDLCNGANSITFALSTITTLVGFVIFKNT